MEMEHGALPDASGRIRQAERLCAAKGVRLTRLRRRVLEILLAADRPVKAYDFVEVMRDAGKRVTPATVYRVLEFLLEHGLAHRVNALNAYMACADARKAHPMIMLVCSDCRKAVEFSDSTLYASMSDSCRGMGFSVNGGSIEIQGKCRDCSAREAPSLTKSDFFPKDR
jgi:Fur family zinc uptake transcriptional regulator